MPERWQCGHCGLVVELPSEQTEHDAYIDAIMRIREHRFGHIADAFMKGTNREMWDMCADDEPDPTSLLTKPVTIQDIAPAVEEAERLVKGGR